LPDSSERTIRYDIQELITKGRLERVGGGGPATAYKLRETPSAGQAEELLLRSGEATVTFS
jgi:DeoR/GlpR family transcriptional regulator of sugar metabolism